MTASGDPILKRFRTALDEIYGDRLERVVLFGSRARGDARPDSDYDVAVFLNEPDSFFGKKPAASRKLKPISFMRQEPSSTLCPSEPELIATVPPLCTKCGAKVLTYDAGGWRLPQ